MSAIPECIAKSFLKHKYPFLILLIFIVAEVLTWPAGEFPLNDDWAYSWSAKRLFLKGDIQIGEWPAMTLWTHLVWALLFLKVFGFSFFTLRMSVWAASVIALLLLYNVVRKKSNEFSGFAASMSVLFFPVYFILTNTFMTDVTFVFFAMIAIWVGLKFFEHPNFSHSFLIFVFGVLLTLIRQFGLTVPIAFAGACLFFKHPKKLRFFLVAIAQLIASLLILKYYENYLKGTITVHAAYKFTDSSMFLKSSFWEHVLSNWNFKRGFMLKYILVFSGVYGIFLLPGLFKKIRWSLIIVFAAFSVLIVHLWLKDVPFPYGNIFENMQLGAETFYQSMHSVEHETERHNANRIFPDVAFVSSYLLCVVTLFVVQSKLYLTISNRRFDAKQFYLCLMFIFYCFFVVMSDSFFDRYLILPVILVLIMVAEPVLLKAKLAPAFLVLIFAAWISIAGTHDYFEMNRTRWKAYYETVARYHVPYTRVNAGFEVNSWNGGNIDQFMTYLDLKRYLFLIQYRKEEGFHEVNKYSFDRWFPPCRDSLVVYQNDKFLITGCN